MPRRLPPVGHPERTLQLLQLEGRTPYNNFKETKYKRLTRSRNYSCKPSLTPKGYPNPIYPEHGKYRQVIYFIKYNNKYNDGYNQETVSRAQGLTKQTAMLSRGNREETLDANAGNADRAHDLE